MFNFLKKKNQEEKDTILDFEFEPRPINSKGSETFDDMSLIAGLYQSFLVTKTGKLVGMIEISGINLELLNEAEQSYAFETLNTFLMNTLGDGTNEEQQFLDVPMPVDFNNYILSYKKRYLNETNEARKELIASYIDDFNNKIFHNTLSTKRHFLVIYEPIKEKTKEALDTKVVDMNEKINLYINRLEDSFSMYNLQAKKIYPDEIIQVLKHMINFNGK